MAWFKPRKISWAPKVLSPEKYLACFFKQAFTWLLLGIFILAPYSALWLYQSGDLALERAVTRQSWGEEVIFGSGVLQDFVDYKLKLYELVKPEIVALGSSRVMQFRGEVFERKFLNMGGVAGNLPVLRSTLEAMLKIHKPEAIILGVDFWWFMPTWNPDPFKEEPPTSGSYSYNLEALKKPWEWLLLGKISFKELMAPFLSLLGLGFRDDRLGIMAQQTSDGFGRDGSWYYIAELTGQKRPFDFQFQDTLTQVEYGTKAFAFANQRIEAPGIEHLEAFSEIYYRLKSRGIKAYVFLPPLADRVFKRMRDLELYYPQLFNLAKELRSRGIQVLDLSDPRKVGSNDCEFVDGFHGGEITYLRILRSLADQWSSLVAYINLNEIQKYIREWQGHALKYNPKLSDLWEIDFMEFNCPKRKPKI
ncbi:MAG: hypothetical protein IJU40_07410 [Desulfovibrionaceae bacterium]|nr:hypothetical protein [Desulfovibrionaceae bacterium]